MLIYFKYSTFAANNVQRVLSLFGVTWTIPAVFSNVLLPLGISFYTFKAVSYTMDVYFGKAEASYSLLNFSLYVSFFPQLISGPIVRYPHVSAQLISRKTTADDIFKGATRFILGLSKKVLLANVIAKAADGIFSLPASELYFGLSWLGVIAYTLQIYIDFSAYSDMAIGLSKVFGFDLLENFNYPYVSKSMQDFWRRWHISLSSWFRDYLYIPLGGNRKGNKRTYLNLVIVFFVCGLWHGAAWTFIIWGLWHGFFLVVERLFLGRLLKKTPSFFQHAYALLAASVGWMIFRSADFSQAGAFFKTMFSPAPFTGQLVRSPFEFFQADVIIATVVGIVISLGASKLIEKRINNSKHYKTWINVGMAAAILLFIVSISSLYSGAYSPFIYFKF